MVGKPMPYCIDSVNWKVVACFGKYEGQTDIVTTLYLVIANRRCHKADRDHTITSVYYW